MWALFAGLSAVFAALTAIFAKVGVQNVNSNLAVAIRTAVVLMLAWGIVFAFGAHKQIPDISTRAWIFLTLSALATGLSWLCYYKALQLGAVRNVVTVDKLSLIITIVFAAMFFGETLTLKVILGALLVVAGTLLIVI